MATEKPFNKQKSIQDQKNLIASRYPAFKGLVNGNAEDMAALVQEFGQDLVDLLLAVFWQAILALMRQRLPFGNLLMRLAWLAGCRSWP